jgi:thiol-disulfide isomerase/thioredoxin
MVQLKASDESERPHSTRSRRTWLLAGVAIAALAGGALIAALQSQRQAGAQSAAALLALALPDTSGAEIRLDQWRGRVLVVNFWATWCAPCREEMPMFVEVQSAYGSKGLQFVGIAVDEAAKVRLFVEEIRLNYPALIGGYGALELSKTLGNNVMALPFTVVVGRDGAVAHTQLGPLKREQLDGIVRQLL